MNTTSSASTISSPDQQADEAHRQRAGARKPNANMMDLYATYEMIRQHHAEPKTRPAPRTERSIRKPGHTYGRRLGRLLARFG